MNFLDRINEFALAINLANKISGCNLRKCEIRERILKGETGLINVFCDICKDKLAEPIGN